MANTEDEWDGDDGRGPEFNLDDPDLEMPQDPASDLTKIQFRVEPDAWLPVEQLRGMFHKDNSQVRWEHEKAAIARSIASFGFAGESIIVNRWNDKIVGGHGRVEVCWENGYRDTLPVVYLDLRSEQEHRRAMLQFNRARGHQDTELEYREIQALFEAYGEPEVRADMAYLQEDIDALIAYANSRGEGEGEGGVPDTHTDEMPPDPAEMLRAKWGVTLGQMWQLGQHRIICGDCTDAVVVQRLMMGDQAVCMWTDPPYGVSYVGKTKDALTIENDGAEGLPLLLKNAYARADAVLVNGAPIYVAHPAGPLQIEFNKAFVEAGWKFHETLIWLKNSMVLGHSDYHYKHEPLMYGWKGKNRFWYSGRDQVSVFEIDRPSRSEEHPTMKPIALIVACLENSTKQGDIVYEPFSGSGSTLIACDGLLRQCRAIELDPRFVAVCLERWSVATGKTPVLISEA